MLNIYHVNIINYFLIAFFIFIFMLIGRPAEIAEDDVYLCESIYDESTKQIKELPKDGLKKYTHSPAVNQDEFYFFRRLIHPVKVNNLINKILLSIIKYNYILGWSY